MKPSCLRWFILQQKYFYFLSFYQDFIKEFSYFNRRIKLGTLLQFPVILTLKKNIFKKLAREGNFFILGNKT
jgi:hypothetical protein